MLFTHTFQFHQFLIYEYINWIYQWNQPKCISFQIKHSISIAWSLIYILPCVWLFDLHTFGFWFSHHCLTATKISLCHWRLSYLLPNFLKKVHFVPWFRIGSKWENIYSWSRLSFMGSRWVRQLCRRISRLPGVLQNWFTSQNVRLD